MARSRAWKTVSPAGRPMSCRARVAERARVSSRGSAASRPRNWAWAGLGTVIGSRSSAAAAWRYLKKLSERGDPAVERLGGGSGGDQVVAPGVDVGDGGLRKSSVASLGPGDLAEGDEGHDVLAVGTLGVLAGAAGDPGFEDLGDREEELLDAFLDPARRGAGQDRRQFADESFGEHDQLARASIVASLRPFASMLPCPHSICDDA